MQYYFLMVVESSIDKTNSTFLNKYLFMRIITKMTQMADQKLTWDETQAMLEGIESIIKQLQDDIERNPELPE